MPLSSEFVRSAWSDIERFKDQKNHDLKESLISYAIMQISMCKKVRDTAFTLVPHPTGQEYKRVERILAS